MVYQCDEIWTTVAVSRRRMDERGRVERGFLVHTHTLSV